jgi:hypothetical protein
LTVSKADGSSALKSGAKGGSAVFPDCFVVLVMERTIVESAAL